jgi:hypothetical protein
VAIAGLTHDLDALEALEKSAKPGTYERVVIGEKYAHRCHHQLDSIHEWVTRHRIGVRSNQNTYLYGYRLLAG